MATIINLTPHDVRLFVNGVCRQVWPACNNPARVVNSFERADIGGVPVSKMVVHEIVNLPEPADDVFYLVSRMVIEAAIDRFDLLLPGAHPRALVRDRFGEKIGVRELSARPRYASHAPCADFELIDEC